MSTSSSFSSSSPLLKLEQSSFNRQSTSISDEGPITPDYPVTGNDYADGICSASVANRSNRPRTSYGLRYLPVRRCSSVRDSHQRLPDSLLKIGPHHQQGNIKLSSISIKVLINLFSRFCQDFIVLFYKLSIQSLPNPLITCFSYFPVPKIKQTEPAPKRAQYQFANVGFMISNANPVHSLRSAKNRILTFSWWPIGPKRRKPHL